MNTSADLYIQGRCSGLPHGVWWRHEPRRRSLTKLPSEAYFALAPDWVCEILSPRTADYDRVEKMEIYCEHKVPFSGACYSLLKSYRGRPPVKPAPFDALPLDLSRIWPE